MISLVVIKTYRNVMCFLRCEYNWKYIIIFNVIFQRPYNVFIDGIGSSEYQIIKNSGVEKNSAMH